MAIMKLKTGDKVAVTKMGINAFGKHLSGKTFTIDSIFHDEVAAKDHIEAGHGIENVQTCSCCNYAKLKEVQNAHFYIEEGDSELSIVD